MPRDFFGGDTPQARADAAGQIWEQRQEVRDQLVEEFETVDDPREVPVGRPGGAGLRPTPGFLDMARPREAAFQLDDQFPRQDLGPDDVRQAEGGGFEPREPVQRQRAAFEIEDQTPLGSVDPQQDLTQTDDGFGLTEPRRRDLAAAELDPQYPAVDLGRDDVRETDDGFGLDPFAEKRVAAEQLEDETPLDQVGTEDVRRTESGFELRDSVIENNIGLFR